MASAFRAHGSCFDLQGPRVLRKLLGRIDLGIGAVRMLHGQLKACKATWLRASNSHKDAARETGFFLSDGELRTPKDP